MVTYAVTDCLGALLQGKSRWEGPRLPGKTRKGLEGRGCGGGGRREKRSLPLCQRLRTPDENQDGPRRCCRIPQALLPISAIELVPVLGGPLPERAASRHPLCLCPTSPGQGLSVPALPDGTCSLYHSSVLFCGHLRDPGSQPGTRHMRVMKTVLWERCSSTFHSALPWVNKPNLPLRKCPHL